jgi:hypothetical protein
MSAFTDEYILSLDRVTPEIAGKYIGADHEFIRNGLKQRVLPFGSAVLCPGGRYSYHISPGLLVAYKRGTLNVCFGTKDGA